ncbi:NAD(P)/FAD-dependent oxidoreductase [Pseudohoeflea coraliihabitans]|uniref:FAD-binding oxidoreductase n=1 Tax=Pseudohoeflea coraliihabitans TaxID=2860393 RepID=A0ABS6WKB6_9HYPH|nr:FAD-binding oxidoreductase [Pseudohoeflea sp. DP4N28-3]MBW3096396.1 FAD-binding oxidoreductase [Pseudohoeflea sp. DP4N28-3]
MSIPRRHCLVIGGGVVGVHIAALLAEAGHQVDLFDPAGIAERTSRGNAAALAFTDIIPLATPGILWKAPRWLIDPLGPLSIRPAYLFRLAPWLLRFALASRPARVEAATMAQAELMRIAEHETLTLAERAGIAAMIRHDGCLELYESEDELAASQPGWDRKAAAGIAYTHLRGAELAALQPGLSPRFVAGTFVPAWKTVTEPQHYARAVWAYAERLGARLDRCRVTRLDLRRERPAAHLSDGRRIEADRIIVAAGAWSKSVLTGTSAAELPLDTERGYNTTLPSTAFDLKRQLIFPGHGFVITPLENGIRVGGAVEFAGLKARPNFDRATAMLDKARQFLPGLDPANGRQWMGYRPSLPDTLPVLGRLKEHRDVILAFGNGHLGLTQAAAMGRLVTDIVSDQPPPLDLAPFRPDRF